MVAKGIEKVERISSTDSILEGKAEHIGIG